ncbi:MAG TPA: nuclear transport factor 2 family protein [Mycobacterium sp.]|nr:nuclear transport factor 2 family protein [Mycobacterium sp.]HTX98098.1 nuclear transport factor 2 family protein [Mycobacterium sp.]
MNSPVKMVVDTPGKLFYEEQVKYLLDKDVDSLVEKHYHDNAVIVSFDHIVRGKDNIRDYFTQFFNSVTIEQVVSTDKFTETEDTLMFEATVESNGGMIKTFDALVLDSGRIRLQFTGVR